MKATYLITLLLCFSYINEIFGQSIFLDSNYVWTEIYIDWHGYGQMRYSTIDKEPSIVNGMNYYEILVAYDPKGENYQGTEMYIRTDDSNRVYLLQYSQEELLYDFNAEEGDTIYYGAGEFGIYIILEIDTFTLLNGEKVERSWVGCVDHPVPTFYILEGIGFPFDLFKTYLPCQIDGSNEAVVCMYRNDTLLLHYPVVGYPDSCWLLISGINEVNNPNQKIYPNPASSVLNIESLYEPDIKVEVIDVFGRQYPIQAEPTLDISNLQQGAYYLFIKKNGVPTIIKNFIKQY